MSTPYDPAMDDLQETTKTAESCEALREAGSARPENVRVDSVKVEWLNDDSPDMSCTGGLTDEAHANAMILIGEHVGKFVHEVESDELPRVCREYRFFIPYAGGEKPESNEFETYARQDFKRMYGYIHDEWQMVGCVVKAEVSYDIGQGSRRIETLSSGGLWGIESDSDKSYLREVEDEQLSDLAEHLGHFGIEISAEELRELAD